MCVLTSELLDGDFVDLKLVDFLLETRHQVLAASPAKPDVKCVDTIDCVVLEDWYHLPPGGLELLGGRDLLRYLQQDTVGVRHCDEQLPV